MTNHQNAYQVGDHITLARYAYTTRGDAINNKGRLTGFISKVLRDSAGLLIYEVNYTTSIVEQRRTHKFYDSMFVDPKEEANANTIYKAGDKAYLFPNAIDIFNRDIENDNYVECKVTEVHPDGSIIIHSNSIGHVAVRSHQLTSKPTSTYVKGDVATPDEIQPKPKPEPKPSPAPNPAIQRIEPYTIPHPVGFRVHQFYFTPDQYTIDLLTELLDKLKAEQ